jgi:hypothetical protein
VRLATRSHDVFVLLFFFNFPRTQQRKTEGAYPAVFACASREDAARNTMREAKNNSRGGGGIRGGHAPRNHTTLRRGGCRTAARRNACGQESQCEGLGVEGKK